MALKIRRGLAAHLSSITPAEGELIYTTDTKKLYVGDNVTPGDQLPTVSSAVVSVNGLQGPVTLTTADITEGNGSLYFTNDRAQDAAGNLLANASTSGITFSYNATNNTLTATTNAQGTITSGTLNTLAYYPTNGTTLQSTVNLGWNDISNSLTLSDGTFVITNNAGSVNPLTLEAYFSSSLYNSIQLKRARGTSVSPTSVITNDVLNAVVFSGHDGTTFKNSASIYSYVSQTASTGIVPATLAFTTAGVDGVSVVRVRISEAGQLYVGPTSTDTGSGSLAVRQTTSGSIGAVVQFRNTFSDAAGPRISLAKHRGTASASTVVQTGDVTGQLDCFGYDGVSGQLNASIVATVEGSVTTGKVPGAITFKVANTNGTLTSVVKINNASTSSSVGTMTVSGTIATASTPGTFWNYDSSASTLTLNTNDTVNFANFSGMVLVNCFNSGCVTQYLCGGGTGNARAIGSSKGTNTGSMDANNGIGGYTFTATETGVHSFYVIRTRTGA